MKVILNWRLLLKQVEREWILNLMAETKYNITHAAQVSGVSRQTILAKLVEYRLLEARDDYRLKQSRLRRAKRDEQDGL